jgi:superoxide dismutase, Fe-Mn family
MQRCGLPAPAASSMSIFRQIRGAAHGTLIARLRFYLQSCRSPNAPRECEHTGRPGRPVSRQEADPRRSAATGFTAQRRDTGKDMLIMTSRRDFLITAGSAGAFLAAGPLLAQAQTQPVAPAAAPAEKVAGAGNPPFALPALPYAFTALEPHIDAKTMELHHDKHHKTYVEKLNAAIAKQASLSSTPLAQLLAGLDKLPEEARAEIRNNGGGHANHTMFWEIMAPNAGGEPKGEVATAINAAFGSFDAFKKRFNEAGAKHFGSGWVFVVMDRSARSLEIVTRANQDSPLMEGDRVLFGNDLWEHAYYLKYNNKREEYLASWWNVVNWDAINTRLKGIKDGEAVI